MSISLSKAEISMNVTVKNPLLLRTPLEIVANFKDIFRMTVGLQA